MCAMAEPDIEKLLLDEQARVAKTRRFPVFQALKREFAVVSEDRYSLSVPEAGILFTIDRLRREHHELIGELSVLCNLPGARTVDGILSTADFNFSSARARMERAKLLLERANTGKDLDWLSLLDEFCLRVLEADRAGRPVQDLRSIPRPGPDEEYRVEGIRLLRRHPTILFGDGGAAKSYLGLYLCGKLVESGIRVGMFDWELAGEDHRERLERLFPDGMPKIWYARCERPLVQETDRLRRIVIENSIDYVLFDSIAFACDGPPESAEIAGKYFRSVRQIGAGSLHIAHISKGENSDQKPFGSAFWHNGARSTWYAQVNSEPSDGLLSLAIFNRKSNLGHRLRAIGFDISFADERTVFRRTDVADNPELSAKLSVPEKMTAHLRRGAMSIAALSEEIEAKPETVARVIRRYKNRFITIEGNLIALRNIPDADT